MKRYLAVGLGLGLLILSVQFNASIREWGLALFEDDLFGLNEPLVAVPTPASEFVAQPQDLLTLVKQRGFLKIGVRVWPDAVFKPPLYRQPQGGLAGYEVDIAWALAEHLGVGLEMTESDPRRLRQAGWSGNWDIALAWLAITDQAQQEFIFSRPYAYDAGLLVVNPENTTISHFDELTGRRIGIPAFTIYHQILTGQSLSLQSQPISIPLPPEVQVVPYHRDGDAVRDLAKGDGIILEAALHSRLVIEAAQEAELSLKLASAPLFWVSIGVAFDRRGLPAERLRLEINTALSQLEETGALSEFSLARYNQDISRPPKVNK